MAATTTLPPQDLPVWMRRAQRSTDWGVLIVLVLSLAVASSFLFQPGLPRTNASERYVYMTSDFATALREGRLYPRWSANALSGYGAPIPNFYPPGAAYSAALAQIFLTGSAVDAVRLLYAIALCLAGAVTYTFVARRASAPAGLIAATLYLFSPYVGKVAPHLLGDLPGMIGLALLPTLLWAVDRLLVGDQAHDLLLVALTTAGLVLTDPRAAVVGLILVAALCAVQPRTPTAGGKWVAIALTLGIILSAFFWLPALAEATATAWYPTVPLMQPPVTFAGLLTPLMPVDPDTLLPTAQLTLGLTGVLGALAGIASLWFDRTAARFEGLFLYAGAALTVAAITVLSSQIWLLGPITLCFAIGASAIWRIIPRLRPSLRGLALPALLIAILVGALPVWGFTSPTSTFDSPNALAQIAYEQSGYGIAVLPPGAPLPSNAGAAPPSNRALLSSYQASIVDKVDSGTLPPSVAIGVLDHETHSDLFSLRVTSPAQIKLLTAYFPGWTASLGVFTVPLSRSDDGLMNLSIPADAGELTITLGTTPVRAAAWAVSWAALILLVIVTVRRFRHGTPSYDHAPLLTAAQARLLGIVVVAFVVVLAALSRTGLLVARPGFALDGSTALRSRTDVGLEALAYRIDNRAYRPGEQMDVSIYWRALRTLPDNYTVHAELVSATPGMVYPPTAMHAPGNYPTQRWLVGHYVGDHFDVPIPPDIPAGQYLIGVEAFDCQGDCAPEDRLTFFDAAGNDTGQVLLLPTLLTIGK